MPGAKDEPYFTVNEEVRGSSPLLGFRAELAQLAERCRKAQVSHSLLWCHTSLHGPTDMTTAYEAVDPGSIPGGDTLS